MSTKMKLLIGFGVYILGCIVIVVATGWHRSQTAELLGISRKVLWEKIRDFGIDAPGAPGATAAPGAPSEAVGEP